MSICSMVSATGGAVDDETGERNVPIPLTMEEKEAREAAEQADSLDALSAQPGIVDDASAPPLGVASSGKC